MRNYKSVLIVIMTFLIFTSCNSAVSNSLTTTISDKESDFGIITIGTGTPEYSETKANASTAIKYNGKYYIIDCGDGSYANMQAQNFDFSNIGGIFLTHHHIDHTTDFFDIYVKSVLTGAEDFRVVGPPRTEKFVDFINDVYLDDILYRKSNTSKVINTTYKDELINFAEVTEIMGEEVISIDGLTVTTAEMSHTMYDLAYKFEADGKIIVVTGDTSYDEDLITLAKGADILVIDGSLYKKNIQISKEKETIDPFYEYGGNFDLDSHMSFEDMVQIATKAGVKKLVITHYKESSEARILTSIKKIKEIFAGEIIYATDMMEINVEDSISME